jgi:hypothetical protein
MGRKAKVITKKDFDLFCNLGKKLEEAIILAALSKDSKYTEAEICGSIGQYQD